MGREGGVAIPSDLTAAVKATQPADSSNRLKGLMRRNRYRRMHVGLLGQSWSGSMRNLLSLMLAVSALGIIPANSKETDLGVCLASWDNTIIGVSNGKDRPDDGRNMSLT